MSENQVTGRLLSFPFPSQIGSISRTRKANPTRLVQWFRHWEKDLTVLSREYGKLTADEKGLFRELQVVFEICVGEPFKGKYLTAIGLQNVEADPFKVMGDLVKVVAMGNVNGLMLVGPGGLGKTYTTRQKLLEMGKVEGRDYYHICGYKTNLSLYNTLYERRDKLLVFDDCDSIFGDEIGLNVLKAALETTDRRIITWGSTSSRVTVPQFQFTGQIIFISNLDPTRVADRNFQALLTRVMTFALGTTPKEIKDRMVSLIPTIGAGLTAEVQKEIEEWLEEHYTRVPNLSIRLLLHLVGLRKSEVDNWRVLALSLQ